MRYIMTIIFTFVIAYNLAPAYASVELYEPHAIAMQWCQEGKSMSERECMSRLKYK